MVRTYRSFRLSESTSVAFRFCSVTLDEDPETNQSTQCVYLPLITDFSHLYHPSLTCWELQASVDRQPGSFAPPDVHGELQAARVRIDAIGEGESHFICPPADCFRRVDQQLVQDVLVGEGGALRQDPAILQRLRVELPSADFS